jgi:nucleolar complex protein 3
MRTALRCMCGLLEALPHFNYRSDLLRALIPRLAADDASVAAMVSAAVTAAIQGDSRGETTLESVQLIADLVKRRACVAPPHAIDALKAVRFDDTLASHLKDEREKDKPVSQKQRNRKWIEERRRLRDEAKSAARNSSDAKKSGRRGGDEKEDDIDERALRDFDALPDVGERLQMQTSTLEAVRVPGRARAACAS